MMNISKGDATRPQGGAKALLDTSAFKAISKEDLADARHRGWHLTTSPWCFFELLCYLDEEPDFARAKGNLMKFRGIEIIDKPLDRAVAKRQDSLQPRIWSSDLTYAALAAIDHANSLDDLVQFPIEDEAGNYRGPLHDAPMRVRNSLKEGEREYQDIVSSLIEVLKSEDSSRTPQRNHEVIMNIVTTGGVVLPDTPDLDYALASKDENFVYTYVYWAYVLLQAIALKQDGRDTCKQNDFEDGQFCAYVPLDESLWVVSADKPLRKRIAEIRELLIAVGLGERACFLPATPDMLLKGDPF